MSDSLELSETTVIEVNEGVSLIYAADLVRDDHKPATPANIEALELTLYENVSGDQQIVNERDAQDVLNANDVELDNGGNLKWNVRSADTAMINTSRRTEDHVAQFRMEWLGEGGITRQHFHYVILRVFNSAKVGC